MIFKFYQMKKIIYEIFKYPLILVFLKTPLFKILKKRFKNYRFAKKKNIILYILDLLFEKEYFNKLKNKEKIRELTNSTLADGEGRKWAQSYYNSHFKTIKELNTRKLGNMTLNDAQPIFSEIINFIKNSNLSNSKDTFIIQLGSSSGRDLEFFLKIFPKLNYISTDINDEILDFQKQKYSYSNLKFFKCYAEDINKCLSYFNISNKNIVLFSVGSLQYVNPFFLEDFFLKIKNYSRINLFLLEPVSLKFIDNSKLLSDNRTNISFSHRYDEYVKNLAFNILNNKIIRPYSLEDKKNGNTGHFYLRISN